MIIDWQGISIGRGWQSRCESTAEVVTPVNDSGKDHGAFNKFAGHWGGVFKTRDECGGAFETLYQVG